MSKLLVLSNGHGEDTIAVRIMEQLQQSIPSLELLALPLVGEGYAYRRANFSLLCPSQAMPSGGFVYMDGQELWKDLQGGLLQLTISHYHIIRQLSREGAKILAVGDVLPLVLAWLSGSPYAFVGTAKSEYYLRDEKGWLKATPWWYRVLDSYYFPWELNLMRSPRCRGVFPRDTLTAKVLAKHAIAVADLGNPMMDGLHFSSALDREKETLTILLLPGSRSPEAERNWQMILRAIEHLLKRMRKHRFLFVAAIAPSLDLSPFQLALEAQNWREQPFPLPVGDSQALTFSHDHKAHLILSQNAYGDCLALADLGIAMAGTATEQLVGLGKPVITFPGTGPQFTPWFAQAQTRLLGESVLLVDGPEQVTDALQKLVNNPDLWQAIAGNGQRRLGCPGAASRIAQSLREKLFSD